MGELHGDPHLPHPRLAVADIHPHLRQITFGGGDLATFAPVGPDTFLYLLLPPGAAPSSRSTRASRWSGDEEMPESEQPVGAYYTLRRWRPEPRSSTS